MCDIPIAPFPRRTPPAKSFVSVLNKSLIQVVRGGIVSSELIAFCINSMNSKTALNSINSAAQSIEPQQVAFDTMDLLAHAIIRTAFTFSGGPFITGCAEPLLGTSCRHHTNTATQRAHTVRE